MHFTRTFNLKPDPSIQQLRTIIADNSNTAQYVINLVAEKDVCSECIQAWQQSLAHDNRAKEEILQSTERMVNFKKNLLEYYPILSEDQVNDVLTILRISDAQNEQPSEVNQNIKKIDSIIAKTKTLLDKLEQLNILISKAISEYEVLKATIEAAKVITQKKPKDRTAILAIIIDIQSAIHKTKEAEKIVNSEIDKIVASANEIKTEMSKDCPTIPLTTLKTYTPIRSLQP